MCFKVGHWLSDSKSILFTWETLHVPCSCCLLHCWVNGADSATTAEPDWWHHNSPRSKGIPHSTKHREYCERKAKPSPEMKTFKIKVLLWHLSFHMIDLFAERIVICLTSTTRVWTSSKRLDITNLSVNNFL